MDDIANCCVKVRETLELVLSRLILKLSLSQIIGLHSGKGSEDEEGSSDSI